MDQDDDWVKSNMVSSENFYYKDFVHLVETGNEKFSKSIFYSKSVFYRIKTFTVIIIVIILCQSAASLSLSALSSPPHHNN